MNVWFCYFKKEKPQNRPKFPFPLETPRSLVLPGSLWSHPGARTSTLPLGDPAFLHPQSLPWVSGSLPHTNPFRHHSLWCSQYCGQSALSPSVHHHAFKYPSYLFTFPFVLGCTGMGGGQVLPMSQIRATADDGQDLSPWSKGRPLCTKRVTVFLWCPLGSEGEHLCWRSPPA